MKREDRYQNVETEDEEKGALKTGEGAMDRLRAEYEEIPVPVEAKLRVRQGILRAKRERSQRSAVRWFRNTGTVMAASLAVLMVIANTSQAAAETLEQIPVLGGITRVVTFRDYTDQKENFEAKMEVPKVEIETSVSGSGLSEAQKKNYELTNEQIDAYAQKFISDYEAALGESGGQGNYALESSYKVLRDDERYLSIRIDTTVVMAGGTQYVKIYNIDKATGKAAALGELFSNPKEALLAVSGSIMEQMRAQMEQDDSKSYFLDTEMPETEFAGLTGDESYYFDGNGNLVIWFNEYDVAPGYMGAVEFTIPAAVFAQYLNN